MFPGFSTGRVEGHGRVGVGHRADEVSGGEAHDGPRLERAGVARGEFDRAVEVGETALEIVVFESDDSPEGISHGVRRREADALVAVGQRLLGLGPARDRAGRDDDSRREGRLDRAWGRGVMIVRNNDDDRWRFRLGRRGGGQRRLFCS